MDPRDNFDYENEEVSKIKKNSTRKKPTPLNTKKVTFNSENLVLPNLPRSDDIQSRRNDRQSETYLTNSKVRMSNERYNPNAKVPTVYKVNTSTGQLPKLQSNNKAKSNKGNSDDQLASLPAIVKNSIIQQQENSVTINLSTFIKYQEFFPLDVFMNFFNRRKALKRPVTIISFDGVESTTDLVFYLLFKHFKDLEIWSSFESVTLDSCRYVTDFGIELLCMTTGKKRVVSWRASSGCKLIKKYLHDEVKLNFKQNDFLTIPSFMCLDEPGIESTQLDTCKILILNSEKNFDFIDFVETKTTTTKTETRLPFRYSSIKLDTPNNSEYKFNLIQVDSNLAYLFNTPYSILVLCIEYEPENFAKKVADVLLQTFNEGLNYLDVVFSILNGEAQVDLPYLASELKSTLKQISELLDEDEEKIFATPDILQKMSFNEQEKLRDKVKLRFSIKKFNHDNYDLNVHFFLMNNFETEVHANLMNKLKSLTKPRMENVYYAGVHTILSQKKYKQKIIKLEEVIDELYSNDTYQYKMLIQTQPKFSNLADDFFQLRNLLGECIYAQVASGQQYIIYDLDWYFRIANTILTNKSEHFKVEREKASNVWLVRNEALRNPAFLDEFLIADVQQAELIVEILRRFNLLMKLQNEKDNFIIVPNYFIGHEEEEELDLANLWPSYLDGCLQTTFVLKFVFSLPSLIMMQIMAAFFKLKDVCLIAANFILCREGFFNILVKYETSKKELELSVRAVDASQLLAKDYPLRELTELKKSILCLFNEYKIVIESILRENYVPFFEVKDKIDSLKYDSVSGLYTNFECRLNYMNSSPDAKPEEFLASEHCFKPVGQFDSNAPLYRCKNCNLNDSWSKLVYDSYRKLYPMFKSVKNWSLMVNLNNVVADYIKPERKSIASLFNIGNETVIFTGTEKMSPFDFDSFRFVLTSLRDADVFNVGISIIKESTMERRIAYINMRTRRLYLNIEKIEIVKGKFGERLIQQEPDTETEQENIRSQRYTKEYQSRILKLPQSVLTQQLSNEEKNSRALLMEQIASLGRSGGDNNTLSRSVPPETWNLRDGDYITIKLLPKNSSNCELSFYYNNEKVGFFLIEDFNSCSIYPYAEVRGGRSCVFFDMSSSRFHSYMANNYSFKVGMYLEVERKFKKYSYDQDSDKKISFIAAAIIEAINENGLLFVRFEGSDESFAIEPYNPLLHPCGYWNYYSKELAKQEAEEKQFRLEPSLIKYSSDGILKWDIFFTQNENAFPAQFNLFNEEQRNGMTKVHFPQLPQPRKNLLACNFKYNPRFAWRALKKLSIDDITEIYKELGVINVRDESEKQQRLTAPHSIVLLPRHLNKQFARHPNITGVEQISNLNVICTHRDDIKLNIGSKNFITNNYPHLLNGKTLDLLQEDIRLDIKHIFLILFTSLDLSYSTNDPLYPNFFKAESDDLKKEFNASLLAYFKQLAYFVCLLNPFFFMQKFRFSKLEPLKKLFIDELAKVFKPVSSMQQQSARPKSSRHSASTSRLESALLKDLALRSRENTLIDINQIERFTRSNAEEFGISPNGMCKYCNLFNVNLAAMDVVDSIETHMLSSIDEVEEYSQIITSIRLWGDETRFLRNESIRTISLSQEIFKHLPNLVDLSVRNLKITKIDEDSIGKCENLKNVEFVLNDLKELSASLFNENSSITQFIIENNPIQEIPVSLFAMQSLRSLVLSRLNLSKLPDGWLGNAVDAIGIRSLCVSQTRLTVLPRDLIRGNINLEQLTFQGVNLILPEIESQWANMVLDLNKFTSLYCPNLLSVEEAKSIFQRFDYDKNNLLDFKELQHLNAFIFKTFPRLGYDSKEEEVETDNDNNQTPTATIADSEASSSTAEAKKFTSFIDGSIIFTIYRCVTLTYLDLSFQAIKMITRGIRQLKNLKVLKLKYCVYLETLSSSVGMLKLNELDLTGCISLKTPPLEIQRRGVNSVLAYLNRLMTGSVECKRTKLMLQGLGGVGKTSLMQALLYHMYQNESESRPEVTDGISIVDWSVKVEKRRDMNKSMETAVEKEELTFSVFDFAGQTVYYNTHQFFLTNRSIYLIVWNVRLGWEHSGLEFWLNSIYCHAPLCPIFIIGTHIDEVSKYELPKERLKKKYSQIAGFHFVSSFDGTGVAELSKAIVEVALNEKYMGEKIPTCWLQFESALKDLKQEKNILDYSEIEKTASNYGIFEKAELTQAIQFLHDLGSLMHFNNEFLRDKVVINPQYMVDLMACLVSVNNTLIQDGMLLHEHVRKIWHNYDPNLHPWILKLTERFDLTFPIAERDLNLVPCLMPDLPPDSSLDWPELNENIQSLMNTANTLATTIAVGNTPRKETIIKYEFEYLPAGLFNRAQVRLYQITDNKLIWRNGSLLKKNNHLALITRSENSIEVKVQGVQPENILFLIHEVLEVLIAESFNGVSYDFSFPCPDCYSQGTIETEKSMFAASLVRRATQMKAVFLQCRHHFHVVPIVDLHAKMPPDSSDNYDLQLRHSVRELKHLKQNLTFDIVIIYSIKDAERTDIIHPRVIKQDLEGLEYACWFTEAPDTLAFESMAIVLRNSKLVVFCISDNFVNDKRCADLFNYTKQILEKGYALIVLGNSFEWMKSSIGALITHELFVKINTIERYKTSWPDLAAMVKKKMDETGLRKKEKKSHPQIFISYARVNSQDAINKGTPFRSKDALGWEDPRSIKTYLEKEGYTCWVDYEQVGSKKNLFDDIVEGIRNSRLMIACISNEYAASESCMREFRFASNIKKPIVLCIFGSPDVNCRWRSTQLGILSVLITKEINFQLENPNAFADLLNEISNTHGIQCVKKIQLDETLKVSETSNDTETAYSELFELAQRKFLRQVATFSESGSSRPFPRLFAVDLSNESSTNDVNNEADSLSNRLCLRALCESESGWHSIGAPVGYETMNAMPHTHFAYLIRIMTLIKQSDIDLDIVHNQKKLDEIIELMEESSSQEEGKSMANTAANFKESYQSVKKYLVEKLDAFGKAEKLSRKEGKEEVINLNRIEHFGLNRCSLASGKIVWLCDEHSKNENVQIFKSYENVSIPQYQNDEFSSILFEELKKYDKVSANTLNATNGTSLNMTTIQEIS